MNSFLTIFKPAPHIPEITDQAIIQQKYKYWRIRIFYSMFIGYILYYFTRNSFTFAMPGIITELHFEKSQLGLLGSIFALTYGISKFASGILSDQANPRFFMAFGLIMTGVCNILFGFSSSIWLFAMLWGFNGWFQGFGWPPCAKFLTHWYSHSERGSWWSTWNISHNVGGFAIPIVVSLCLQYFGWRYALFIPGTICILGGFFLINRLRDTPQSLGLPIIEKFRNDYGNMTKNEAENEKVLSSGQLLKTVVTNKLMWALAIAYFCVYIVRIGMVTWTSLYLIESRGYSPIGASSFVSLPMELGGMFGSLAAGWISDKLFQARRGPINALFSIGLFCSVLLFWISPFGNSWADTVAIASIGFMIFGPQMMIGVTAAEIAHKNAAATATGFTGWVAYIGAAVAGFPMGYVIDQFGWQGYFWFLAVCSGMAALLLVPLWNIGSKKTVAQRA